MQLILYPFIIFIVVFLIQVYFILRKNKNTEKKRNDYLKLTIKIIVALIISGIIGISSFYILGIYVLAGLRAGH